MKTKPETRFRIVTRDAAGATIMDKVISIPEGVPKADFVAAVRARALAVPGVVQVGTGPERSKP